MRWLTVALRDVGEASLSEEVVAQLRAAGQGEVAVPADPGYAAVRPVFNAMHASAPALAVRRAGHARRRWRSSSRSGSWDRRWPTCPSSCPSPAANIAWVRDRWAEIARFGTGEIYLNFTGLADESPASGVDTALGRNVRRLAEIKATYDPDNRFRRNNNIAPVG